MNNFNIYQYIMSKRNSATIPKKSFSSSTSPPEHLTGIQPGSVVLEMGCGLGQTAVSLAKNLACRVDAFDPCPHFIAQARKYAQREGVTDRIRFHCEDIRHGLLPTNRYDVALAEGSFLAAVDDREAVLKLLCRTVKPGGLLYLADVVLAPWITGKVEMSKHSEHLYYELLPQLHCEITASKFLNKDFWSGSNETGSWQHKLFQQSARKEQPSAEEGLGYLYIIARKKEKFQPLPRGRKENAVLSC
jgi:ubiquinone/menaquinone biosynthesis C-methylase UbiE